MYSARGHLGSGGYQALDLGIELMPLCTFWSLGLYISKHSNFSWDLEDASCPIHLVSPNMSARAVWHQELSWSLWKAQS